MNGMSRKYKDVEQDLKHKWFRHSCILQKVIHWAFILHLSNYIRIGAVISDSRNHHTSFPFKRGNKYFICKAFCIRGSQSPSLALCLVKPPRQTAAYPRDGLQRCRDVQYFAHNGSGSCIARSWIYTSSLEMHLTEPITHVATLNEWDFIASIFLVLSLSS